MNTDLHVKKDYKILLYEADANQILLVESGQIDTVVVQDMFVCNLGRNRTHNRFYMTKVNRSLLVGGYAGYCSNPAEDHGSTDVVMTG